MLIIFFSLEYNEFLIIDGPERGLNLIIILFWSTTFFFSTSIFFFSTLTFILRQAPPPAQSPTLFPISYFAASLQSIVTRWSLSRRRVSSFSISRLLQHLQFGGSSSSIVLSSVPSPPCQPSANQTRGLSNLDGTYS
ncbi:hypothetical protein Bca4012_045794 [Brassica carinata]